MGGAVLLSLVRLGVEKITIWDMDTVSAHNLGNQVYRFQDIGKKKTDALEDIAKEINPNVKIIKKGKCTTESPITGIIFLTIDNIDVRRELCTRWLKNPEITFIQDGRMRLTDGNIHAVDWSVLKERDTFLASMQYTHEEALANTPVSACGMTLSVICTPTILANLMVSNMILFCNTATYHRMVLVDAYHQFLDAYIAN